MATPYDMRPRVDPSAISKPQQAGLPGQPPQPGAQGPQQGPQAPQTQAQSPGQPPQGGMSQAAGQSRFAGATAQSAAPRNSAPIQPQPMPASNQPSAHGASYWDRSAGHIRNTGGGNALTYAKAVAPGQVPTTLPYGLSNQIGWANAVAGQHINFAEPSVEAAPDGIPEGTPDGQVPPSNGSKGNAPQGKKTGAATGSTGQGLDSGSGEQPGVVASASAVPQAPPQTGSTVKLETGGFGGGDTIPGVENAQVIDLDGVRGWYDPQTGTTYRDNGDGTASVVVDKRGYDPKTGRPYTGDAMSHPTTIKGPNGETVGQNSENGTYWYLDKNGNAVQVNASGQPLNGQGGVQLDAEGNPVQGGGKTQDEKDWQDSINKALGTQAPQMSEADIQGSIDADRKRQAYEQSQAIALQMGLSGNMSAEQFGANVGRTATEFGTQGAQREAATRLQLKLQNLEGQMQDYKNKIQIARDMAARADSKENRDYALSAAAMAESRQMAMQMEYAKFQRELNKLSFGEGLLGVFSGILGGAANAGISRLIGGK